MNRRSEKRTRRSRERFCRFLLDYSAASVGGRNSRGARRAAHVQQLERMVTDEESSTVRVDFFELDAFDGELASLAVESHYRFEPCVRAGAKRAYREVRARVTTGEDRRPGQAGPSA